MSGDIVSEKLSRLKAYLSLCRRYCNRGVSNRGDSYSIRYIAIGIYRLLEALQRLGVVLKIKPQCSEVIERVREIGEAMFVARYSAYTDEQILEALCSACPCIEQAIAEKLAQYR